MPVFLKHEEFQLELGNGWVQVKDDDPEQFTFESTELRSSVVISVMLAHLPKERLLEAAGVLAESRKQAELNADPTRKVVFGDSWVTIAEAGEAGHIAYAGYDDRGQVFRFMGWVTQLKVLSFWVVTETRDNEFSERVFDEVFSGFRIIIP